MIHGSCADYRSAATIDLEHDNADIATKLACPTLAFWGTEGAMHKNFDIAAAWRKRSASLRTASLPAGHFFIDKYPLDTARILTEFLSSVRL
jgi:haloacetate dehalogenase